MTEPPLVLIEWEDSAQPMPAWVYLADFEAGAVVRCTSVGWLIHDGAYVKALAPNKASIEGEDSAQVSGVIRIPTRSVVRIIKLFRMEDCHSQLDTK